MKEFTVIGIYDDTGEVVRTFNAADDATAAMVNVSRIFDANPNLSIIGAIEGNHCLTIPGESGFTSAASDLAQLEV